MEGLAFWFLPRAQAPLGSSVSGASLRIPSILPCALGLDQQLLCSLEGPSVIRGSTPGTACFAGRWEHSASFAWLCELLRRHVSVSGAPPRFCLRDACRWSRAQSFDMFFTGAPECHSPAGQLARFCRRSSCSSTSRLGSSGAASSSSSSRPRHRVGIVSFFTQDYGSAVGGCSCMRWWP